MTVLEVLREAEGRLTGFRTHGFNFRRWESCTCGQIYAAANGGRKAADAGAPQRANYRVYREALIAVIEANPVARKPSRQGTYDAAQAVSAATLAVAGRTTMPTRRTRLENRRLRRAGATLVRNAIRMIEAREAQNRLDVLSQANRIVAEAEAKEPIRL